MNKKSKITDEQVADLLAYMKANRPAYGEPNKIDANIKAYGASQELCMEMWNRYGNSWYFHIHHYKQTIRIWNKPTLNGQYEREPWVKHLADIYKGASEKDLKELIAACAYGHLPERKNSTLRNFLTSFYTFLADDTETKYGRKQIVENNKQLTKYALKELESRK